LRLFRTPLQSLSRNTALLAGLTLAPATFFCTLSPTLWAQETGQVAGTVTDVSGAVVPDAVVTIKNLGTNATRTAKAESNGSFTFTNLQPAAYQITVAASGGLGAFTENVDVTVGGRQTVDVKLSPNSSSTNVEVAAAGGAQVNTQTQELSQVISQTQVSQLPSLTRNPYDFVALSGNISSGDAGSNNQAQNSSTYGVGFSLNGQRSSGTEILLDGVENVSVFGDGVGILVPIDAVQEYRIITSNFDPQYGRASGGVVNVSTKSGTNQLHGTLWGFNRLSDYTANTVTNAQAGNPKGTYTRNQFGFAVGGPIIKDKLFFFGSTEWVRVRSAASLIGAIPTPQFLAQAAPNIQAFFAAYGTGAPNFSSTVSNAQLTPAGSPAGTALTYPNLPANFPVFGNVAYTAPADAGGGEPQNTYNIDGRIDYDFSDRTQTFFRYVDYNQVEQSGSGFTSPYSQYDVGLTNKNQAYLLNVAHEFNSQLTTITKLSFSRFNASDSYNKSLQNVPTLFVSVNAQIPGTSNFIALPGFYNTNPGNGGLPYGGPQNTIQYNQDVNLQKGTHSIQAGGQLVYIQDNNAYGAYAQAGEQLGVNEQSGLAALNNGSLFEFEAAVNPNGALPCVKNQYTGALAQNAACSINLPATSPSFARSERFHDWAAYAQDSWKVLPKLTFNYGVRYEYFGVQHNDNGNLDSNFYFGGNVADLTTPQEIRSGQVFTAPKSPVGGLWKPQYGTVSPRIGFAYDLFGNGKASLRGGYGISYERNFGNVTFNVIQNPPNYAVIVQNNVQVTNSNAGPLGAATGSVALPPTSLRNVSQNIRTAQTQFWSLTNDLQLAQNSIVSLTYTGSRGIHLYDIKNYNGLGSGNALLGDPVLDPGGSGKTALTRLNPQYSNINNRGSNGDSYYHALNVQFQSTQLHNTGLSVVANYTWSHETDDLSSTFSASNNEFSLGYTNPFDPGFDHGNGDFDIRNRFVLAPIYQTPSLSSHSALMKELLGGYEVTGIYTVHTGTPFTFFDSTNNASGYNIARYTPASGQVLQHTFKKIPSGETGGGANSYNLGALPAAVSFGNPNLLGKSDWGPFPATMTRRNAFTGPGLWGFDASLSKRFALTEKYSVELRAEGFNVLNHHDLFIQAAQNDVANYPNGAPQIIASKGGIGNNGGASDERRFGQFAAKFNF
jgi:hypothetical protein